MQNAEGGGRPPINTAGKVDGYVLLLVLFGTSEPTISVLAKVMLRLNSLSADLFAGREPGPIGRACRSFLGWLCMPGQPDEPGPVGLWLLMVILLLVVLRRNVLGKLVGLKRYDVGRAAFMALVGAPLWVVLAFPPIMLLEWLLAHAGLPWLNEGLGFILFPVMFGAPGVWSGWRFGRWGWAWGMAGIVLTDLLIGGMEFFLPRTLGGAVVLMKMLAGGALGGWLGAWWFQRKQRAEQPPDSPAPSPSEAPSQ